MRRAGILAVILRRLGSASGPWLSLIALVWTIALPLDGADGRAVREHTYRALGRADRAIEKERYAEALAILDELAPKVERVPFERALVQQARAVVLIEQDRHVEAVPALESAIDAGVLSETNTERLRFNLVQVDLVLGEPERALERMDTWFAGPEATPSPELIALAARAHSELEDHETAAQRLREAIEAEPEPPTWWYQLLLTCDYQMQNYEEAASVLRILLKRMPTKTRYWVELARGALELDREDVALSALELGEDVATLDGDHVVLLARLNMQAGIPARAARLLKEALDSGRIPADSENLELLATAWTIAREYEPASEALQRAAAAASEKRPALLLRRGELLVQLDRLDEASADLEVAAGSGDVKIASRASLMLGVVLYRRQEYTGSLAAFGAAMRHDSVRDQAREWERFVRARAARN